jgi:tripartite-type tricarboxylate transporter receptor subunit TctC
MSFDFTRRRFLASGAALAAFPGAGTQVSAQGAWPNRPIKAIVGYPAGGQTDLFARTYGDYLAKQLRQPVLVENKAGAGGTIAAVEVKRAPPDGYTLMFTISTTMIANRALMKNIAYDADKDFVLISIMPAGSIPLIAGEKTGAKNLNEFIEFARKAPKVSVGTYAAGSWAHIAIAELNRQYGLKMEPVHYRGEAPMWTDLASKSIDAGIGSYFAALPLLQSGRAQVVAVHRKRSSVLPDVPTFMEQGAVSKAFMLTGFQCCVAPAGTPPEIVSRLSQLLVEAGKGEQVREMNKVYGLDEAALSFEETQRIYKEETPIWLELIGNLGLQPV